MTLLVDWARSIGAPDEMTNAGAFLCYIAGHRETPLQREMIEMIRTCYSRGMRERLYRESNTLTEEDFEILDEVFV